MAVSVPIDYQNRVQADPLPREQLRAANFGAAGEMVGNAVARFGQAGQQMVEQQDKINAQYDEAAVKTTIAKSLDEIAPIRNAALSARGMDAAAAKVKARADFDGLRKKYVTSLANSRQQQLFESAFQRVQLQEYETYDRHEAKEIEVATIDGSKSRQAASISRATDLAGVNDEAADDALADALIENKTLYRGADPATMARANAEIVSGFRVSVAQKLADGAADSPGDALAAKAYIDSHAAEILPADETKLRRALQGDVDDAVNEAAYGEVLGAAHGLESEPSPEDADREGGEIAKANADPLRGRGKGITSTFTSARDGGKRQHAAEDIAAPSGTAVYPPMTGKVEKVWYDKEGGNSVLVRHPDGRVTGYAHLRNVNVEPGQSVDAGTVLGGVGNTGAASRGNHLHFTVRNESGKRVDPAAQTWREQGVMTPTTDRADVQSLYERARVVAARRNLSPKQTRDLLARIDGDVSRNDRLRARAEDEARDAAYTVIDRLGDNFTDVSQIPVSARSSLAPGVLSTLKNVAKSNKEGDSVPTGGETYFDIFEMAGNPSTQAQFKSLDLYPLRPKMAKGEWMQLRKEQIEMQNGGSGDDVATDYARIGTMVNRYTPQAPVLLDKRNPAARERRIQVETRVREQVAVLQQKKGGKLTDDELAGVVRGQISSTYLAPKAGTAGARTAKTVPGVPDVETQLILTAWRQRYGNRPITAGDVTRLYLQGGGTLK